MNHINPTNVSTIFFAKTAEYLLTDEVHTILRANDTKNNVILFIFKQKKAKYNSRSNFVFF